MRMTLLTSAAVLGFALSLPAFAQTATDPTPANPSAVKDGTPGAGTGSGAAPGNDPATSGKTGATLGSDAPRQDPGPMGATTNPAPQDSSGTPPASATGMGTSGSGSAEQPTTTAPKHHRRMTSTSSGASMGNGNSSDEGSTGRWAHQPGTGMSGPASAQASNIDSADTRSTIAPHLPQPKVGMNAGPDGYLRAADRALAAHKTGAAQQALEMAETRLLDRSTAPDAASQPDQSPRIAAVSAARKALASRDWKGARASIQEAMNTSSGMGNGGMASDSGSPMPAGASSGGMQNGMSSSNGSMGAGTVSPTPNPGNSSPPVNPTGTGPDGSHAIGTGNGGGALGTSTNDSAGGAK